MNNLKSLSICEIFIKIHCQIAIFDWFVLMKPRENIYFQEWGGGGDRKLPEEDQVCKGDQGCH